MIKTVNKISPRDIEVITEVTSISSSFYNYDELLKLQDATQRRRDQFNQVIDAELAMIADLLTQCNGLGMQPLPLDTLSN